MAMLIVIIVGGGIGTVAIAGIITFIIGSSR
jgi:hypothetical protein